MVKIGEWLPSPEEGWRRVEDTDKSFQYTDGPWATDVQGYLSGGSMHYIRAAGGKVKFSFTGNKLRLLTGASTTTATFNQTGYNVNIDGEDFGNINICNNDFWHNSAADNTVGYSVLTFEALNLTDETHSVIITTLDKSAFPESQNAVRTAFAFDAVDIGENSQILPYKSIIKETIDGQQITYRKAITTKQIANPGSAAKILITTKHTGTIIALCCSSDDGDTWHLAKADDYTAIAPGSSVKLKILMDADAELMAYGVGWL